jgi:phosphatidylinositol alpha-mannosyltransferase
VRVGVVCPYSLSVPGGVQAQALGLARVLRRRGHEVRVLAPCDGPPPEAYVTPLGNSIPTAANGSVAPIAPDPAATLRTIRALRDEDFDVLHLHEPLAPGATMTTLVMHPAPIVATFHAAGDSSSYRWLNAAVTWLADRIDTRVAVSADAERLARSYLGGSYEVLFNGVELDRWERVEPVKHDAPTIFFCGRHEPRKGLDVLLAAMAALPAAARCEVAGDGPDTAALQARHAGDPRITWLGRVSDDDKAARLKGASVFCAPSLGGESFGVVLVEAMAAGTPIVASDLAGYRNVARQGVDALLVPPGNVDALVTTLRTVLADDRLGERLRRNSHERALQFSMDGLADRYVDIYDGLVRAARRGDERVRTRRGRRRNIPSA